MDILLLFPACTCVYLKPVPVTECFTAGSPWIQNMFMTIMPTILQQWHIEKSETYHGVKEDHCVFLLHCLLFWERLVKPWPWIICSREQCLCSTENLIAVEHPCLQNPRDSGEILRLFYIKFCEAKYTPELLQCLKGIHPLQSSLQWLKGMQAPPSFLSKWRKKEGESVPPSQSLNLNLKPRTILSLKQGQVGTWIPFWTWTLAKVWS